MRTRGGKLKSFQLSTGYLAIDWWSEKVRMNGVRHSILAKRKCPPGCEGQKGEHRLGGRSHSGGEELDSGAKNLMGQA